MFRMKETINEEKIDGNIFQYVTKAVMHPELLVSISVRFICIFTDLWEW